MIQMERDGQAGFNFRGLYQLGQIGVVSVLTGAGGHLKNHGSVQLLAGFGNSCTISILFTLNAPMA